MSFQFEWDERKRLVNIAKHCVDFYDATLVFDNPVLEAIDDSEDYGEERIKAYGMVETVVLRVIYTMRGDVIRLISAQKASRNDREKYYSFVFHG